MDQQQDVFEKFYSNTETAKILCIQPNSLNNLRFQGKGPDYIKVGRKVLYPRSSIERFLKENTHTHTANA